MTTTALLIPGGFEIKPPGAPEGPEAGASLAQAIASQWRELVALLLCFLSIGVYWLSHHYSVRIYTRSDHVFSVINLGFLLAVTVLPYPLRIWCYHVGTAHEATTGLVLPGLFWMGKWFYALPDRRLMDRRLTDEFLAQLTRRYSIAVGVELLAIPLAALSPRAGVALSLGVVAFFLIPPPKPRYRDGQAPSASDVAGG